MLQRMLKRVLPMLAIAMLLLVPMAVSAQTAQQAADQKVLGPDKNTGLINKEAYSTVAQSAGGLFSGVTVACWLQGSCSFCDGLIVFINVANGILRLLAIVAVVFFMYGAGLLMMSNGNEDMVHRGKAALKATVIGTIIVLFAWQAMSLVVYVLAQQNPNSAAPQNVNPSVKNEPSGLSAILNWYNVPLNQCRPSTVPTNPTTK